MRWARRIISGLIYVGLCMLMSCSVQETMEPEELEQVQPPERPAEMVPVPQSVEELSSSILRAKGTRWVDGEGREVILKGCNLGNWLLLEMWMLELQAEIPDQHAFESILEKRFGPDGKEELMELYRSNWITERDFPIIRSFGFNTLRVPFHYSLLVPSEGAPEMRPDGFKWLDWVIAMARKYRMYVILDLHGTPGGQSIDHTTGRVGQDKLWTTPAFQERTIWLWTEIAKRYRDEPAVAAYDLINEPFGDTKTGKHLPALSNLCDRLYHAIRTVDPHHLVILPGTHQGLDFYGDPRDRGLENYGFTEHYYPGLFGQEASVETHARFIARKVPSRASYLERQQAPFLVGEFNVVFKKVGGAALMRRYYDVYAERGWAATMWSYKLLKTDGGLGESSWAMVANKDPIPPVSLTKSSRADIEAYFRWFGQMKYDVNQPLGAALTQEIPPEVFLPEEEAFPSEPPARDPLPQGWSADDINGSLEGGQKVHSASAFDVYGGGHDIWDVSDQFRLVWRKVHGNFELEAVLESLDEPHRYAKAGLMVRRDLSPESPHLLLNVFPGGDVVLGWRGEAGGKMEQKQIGHTIFPVWLRLRRKGHMVEAGFSSDGKKWTTAQVRVSEGLGLNNAAGLAVLSHDNHVLATASFRDIRLGLPR